MIRTATSTFILEGASLAPRSTTTATISDALTALGASDDLVAAVLGLTDLAFLLRRDGAVAAADAVVSAIAGVSDLVDDALSSWPPEEAVLQGLRAERFAAFSGQSTQAPAASRPPNANEVRGGPLARMNAQNLAKTKKDSP